MNTGRVVTGGEESELPIAVINDGKKLWWMPVDPKVPRAQEESGGVNEVVAFYISLYSTSPPHPPNIKN